MSQAISLVLSCCMLFNTVVVPMLNVKNTVSNPVNQLDNTSSSPKVTMMNNLEIVLKENIMRKNMMIQMIIKLPLM